MAITMEDIIESNRIMMIKTYRMMYRSSLKEQRWNEIKNWIYSRKGRKDRINKVFVHM